MQANLTRSGVALKVFISFEINTIPAFQKRKLCKEQWKIAIQYRQFHNEKNKDFLSMRYDPLSYLHYLKLKFILHFIVFIR